MDILPRRPREPEQRKREQHRPHHRAVEPVLGLQLRVVARGAGLVRPLLICNRVNIDKQPRSQDDTKPDTEESEPALARVEAVDAVEDDGERVEEAEQDAEVECRVHAETRDDGLGAEHAQRTQDRDEEEELDAGEAGGERVGWRRDGKALRAVLEDDFLVGFLRREGDGVGEEADEEDGPLGPAPALGLGGEAADRGPDGGAEEGGQEEDGAGGGAVDGGPEVGVCAGADGEGACADGAGEEAAHQQGAEVGGEAGAEGEEEGGREGVQVDGAAAEGFADRGGDDGAEG